MNWLKKGPELKLPSFRRSKGEATTASGGGLGAKAPDFIADLYYDLRERRLLPLIALVVVAIAAVPLLLGNSEEVVVPPSEPGATAGSIERPRLDPRRGRGEPRPAGSEQAPQGPHPDRSVQAEIHRRRLERLRRGRRSQRLGSDLDDKHRRSRRILRTVQLRSRKRSRQDGHRAPHSRIRIGARDLGSGQPGKPQSPLLRVPAEHPLRASPAAKS